MEDKKVHQITEEMYARMRDYIKVSDRERVANIIFDSFDQESINNWSEHSLLVQDAFSDQNDDNDYDEDELEYEYDDDDFDGYDYSYDPDFDDDFDTEDDSWNDYDPDLDDC